VLQVLQDWVGDISTKAVTLLITHMHGKRQITFLMLKYSMEN